VHALDPVFGPAADLHLGLVYQPADPITGLAGYDQDHLALVREDLANRAVDGHHEEAGCAWLAQHFGPEVTEPIRLHVAAKRYLCAVSPSYLERLSPASRKSLSLQGGAMSPQECAEFESNPAHGDALQLRRYDDAAKVPGLEVPGLEHYRERLLKMNGEFRGSSS